LVTKPAATGAGVRSKGRAHWQHGNRKKGSKNKQENEALASAMLQ
jgi:hypothetical protein